MAACRAYGNTVDSNLIFNLSGPNWAKTVAFVGVFIQIIVSFQVRGGHTRSTRRICAPAPVSCAHP